MVIWGVIHTFPAQRGADNLGLGKGVCWGQGAAPDPPENGITEQEEAALSSCQRICTQERARFPEKGPSPSTYSSLVPTLGLLGFTHPGAEQGKIPW